MLNEDWEILNVFEEKKKENHYECKYLEVYSSNNRTSSYKDSSELFSVGKLLYNKMKHPYLFFFDVLNFKKKKQFYQESELQEEQED